MTWRRLERQQSLWGQDELATTTQVQPSAQPVAPQTAAAEHPAHSVFAQVFRVLRPRTPVPEFEVKFRRYADANNVIRVRDGKVLVGLSDLLQSAPRSVLEAILFILLAKLFRKPIPEQYQGCYRRYLNRRSVRKKIQAIRIERGRKWISTPQGAHFHLDEIFDQLNAAYFESALRRPHLTWSRSASRTLLGHFDAAHNAIVISRIFDRAAMPRFAVEYIMYHEMLHLKHPVTHTRDRRCFHSSEFRAEEKRFPHYVAAKRLLEKL